MLVNFNLEGLEEKDVREIKYLLQEINDTLEGGIWHTNIKAGAITGILSDSLYNTKIGTEALKNNITTEYNTAMGYQSLYSNISSPNLVLGCHNSAFGVQSLYSNVEGYRCVAIGFQAFYSNTIGKRGVAVGYEALRSNTSGYGGVAVGYKALHSNITGKSNTAVGHASLEDNTSGKNLVALGAYALMSNTIADENVAIGFVALGEGIPGNRNVAIGFETLIDATGANNVGVGALAGNFNVGDGSIFLGYSAGYNETGSNKLYIANSNTTTPLIYGEFDNDLIEIYGNLGIGTRVFGTSATRTLAMLNGTVPSTSPANAIQLYAEDVTASSELKVRDEATNVTTLSPHNFELFKPDKNDPFPWSYHSVNQLIGKKVNADISGALRELEDLTGKKFLYYEDVDKISLSEYLEKKKEQLIENYIAENIIEIEVEKDEAWGEIETEVQDTKVITGYDTKYEFDDKTGKVKEIKKPKYKKKKLLKNKLKKGYRFNEETGKFLKIIKPTEKEAEKAIKKELTIPDWIEDRL